jgi:hypothetical protein
MKITLEVKTTDGEETTLTALVPDFVAWERHSKRKISDLAAGIGMEDLAFLAYSVLKRTGVNVKPFDGWINSVENIEPIEEDPKATS